MAAALRYAAYKALYDESVRDPTGFWDRMARENITWDKPYHTVMQARAAADARGTERGRASRCWRRRRAGRVRGG